MPRTGASRWRDLSVGIVRAFSVAHPREIASAPYMSRYPPALHLFIFSLSPPLLPFYHLCACVSTAMFRRHCLAATGPRAFFRRGSRICFLSRRKRPLTHRCRRNRVNVIITPCARRKGERESSRFASVCIECDPRGSSGDLEIQFALFAARPATSRRSPPCNQRFHLSVLINTSISRFNDILSSSSFGRPARNDAATFFAVVPAAPPAGFVAMKESLFAGDIRYGH